MSGHVLPLQGSTGPWASGRVTPSALCVLAPNPSPWTLDGTNTWLLTAPDSDRAVLVDPGPRRACMRRSCC
jgi:glyoxylase-like metal-dependent hydrolase (beta-lactamase superfamily II)